MDRLQIEPPAAGVRILTAEDATSSSYEAHLAGDLADVPIYHGVSFCDAVRRAGAGQALRILPGSIEVCRWAPVVLGLKEAESRFERGLEPRLPAPIAGLLLAPLDVFCVEPQVVILRTDLATLRTAAGLLGADRLWSGHDNQLDRSALPALTNSAPTGRLGLIHSVNRALAALAPLPRWRTLTERLFRSSSVSAAWEALISRTMADMSVCRNSTVIPLQTDRVNVSFFCSGGITWGENHPGHLTSGWPWLDFKRLCRPRNLQTQQTTTERPKAQGHA
jgi:uncharacterized protein (DUF169 family)